jgi:ribonuclease HI
MDVPRGWDDDSEHAIKVATYGSVVFGVGYHSWVAETKNEQVILSGGGPYDGYQLIMISYRSELRGIATGLAVIGTLATSGKIKVRSIKLGCDNEVAIKASKIKRTHSVFHITEGDHDMISTIHYLQDSWCQDIDVQYEWVKGHANELNREATKNEFLNSLI